MVDGIVQKTSKYALFNLPDIIFALDNGLIYNLLLRK